METNRFASELKKQLMRNGMTQKDLADRLGYSKASVSLWLKGTSLPKPSTMLQIEKVLRLAPNTLVNVVYDETGQPHDIPDISEVDPNYRPATAEEDFAVLGEMPELETVTTNLTPEFTAFYNALQDSKDSQVIIGNATLMPDQVVKLLRAIRKIVFGI